MGKVGMEIEVQGERNDTKISAIKEELVHIFLK